MSVFGKKKSSLGTKVVAEVAVAGAAPSPGFNRRKGKGRSVGVLPPRATPLVEFQSTLPPNLLSQSFYKTRFNVFRPDYLCVVVSILVGVVGICWSGARLTKAWGMESEASSYADKAAEASSKRAALEKDAVALQKRLYEAERLTLPASAQYSFSAVLFNVGRSLPREFFMAELDSAFEPEFYSYGKRVTVKSLDHVDAYVPHYTVDMKVQGLGRVATSSKIDSFVRAFDPPAVVVSSEGSEEGAAFELEWKYAPLVLMNPPQDGSLSQMVGHPVDPVVPSLASQKH